MHFYDDGSSDEGQSCRLEITCRLGCVCASLFGKRIPRNHCGHEECMFGSSCQLTDQPRPGPFSQGHGKAMLTRSKTSFSLTSSHPNPFYDETDPHVDSESEVRGDGNFDYPGSPRIFGVRRGCRGRPRLNKQPVVRGARGRPRLNRNCLLPSFIGRLPVNGQKRFRVRGRPRYSSVFESTSGMGWGRGSLRFPVPPNEPFEDVITKYLGIGQFSVYRDSIRDVYDGFDRPHDRLSQLGLQIDTVTEMNFIQDDNLKSQIGQMRGDVFPDLKYPMGETVSVAVLYEGDLQVTRVIFPVGLRHVYFEKTLLELPEIQESEFWILQRVSSNFKVTDVSFKVEERYHRFEVSNEMVKGLLVSSVRGHILKAREADIETHLRIVVSPTFLNHFFAGPFVHSGPIQPFVGHRPVDDYFKV